MRGVKQGTWSPHHSRDQELRWLQRHLDSQTKQASRNRKQFNSQRQFASGAVKKHVEYVFKDV